MTELIVHRGNNLKRVLVTVLAASAVALACSSSGGDDTDGGTATDGGDGGGGSGSDTGGSSGSDTGGSSGSDTGTVGNNCTDFAGAYDVTTEIVATDCSLGLHTITQPVKWTFTQSAPSCAFTMKNSVYPDCVYSGYFTMAAAGAKITWTQVVPDPIVASRTLTYTSEDLSISVSSGRIIFGSFNWSSSSPCTGTTNVCHGTVPAGCATPN